MKKTILIIEDNEKNMYLMTYILEKSDYRVIQAKSGEEGIREAIQEKPDMILLDIQLPLMDGYEVALRLKADSQTLDIPIVAVTSYAMVGDKEKILAAGCDGYMEKPIDPEKIIPEIEEYI